MAAEAPDQCLQCGPIQDLTDQKIKEHAVQRLEESLRERIGVGHITGCSLVLEERFGQGFSAVGGSCDEVIADKKAQWMICSDDGVGNFASVVGARWWTNPKLYLTQFLQSNCVGG
jgi:hypothetical protein